MPRLHRPKAAECADQLRCDVLSQDHRHDVFRSKASTGSQAVQQLVIRGNNSQSAARTVANRVYF